VVGFFRQNGFAEEFFQRSDHLFAMPTGLERNKKKMTVFPSFKN
jgi:hypothetical protein